MDLMIVTVIFLMEVKLKKMKVLETKKRMNEDIDERRGFLFQYN